MKIDYLIVGQGLAGSVVALNLIKRGYKIHVIDNFDPQSSSRVAAGIYNPVTGKEMKKTWFADKLFPTLHKFYKEAEVLTESKFFFPLEMYRPFLSIHEQNDWMAKSSAAGFSAYVKEISSYSLGNQQVYDDFGGISLLQCGYLHVVDFLNATRTYLETSGSYELGRFTESDLLVEEDSITYKNIDAKKVIYCNGNEAKNSQYFGWLPFRPVKGEILRAKSEVALNKIYNRGVFIVPLSNGLCNIGATYNWRTLDVLPTEEARKELLDKLNKLSPLSFEIKGHIAGIRPATKDRKPFVGIHPSHKALSIFNGLGAKGVSLAPYLAQNFVEFLERKEELHPEVNIIRYFSLY